MSAPRGRHAVTHAAPDTGRMPSELFVGLMSGTSMDGVDGVLVEFLPELPSFRVLAHAHAAFDAPFARELLALNSAGDNEIHRAAMASNAMARIYARVVEQLLAASGVDHSQVRAIGAHGQTVRHRPGAVDGVGYTVQLNAPALLCELTGISVIADFRSRDVAAGGQGAPLVPAFHRAAFGRVDADVVVLNIGGISNVTAIGRRGTTFGFDCGPGNALMDHWCQTHTGRSFDEAGAWAASGQVDDDLLDRLLEEPYFSQRPPKSTGRDLFNPGWLNRKLQAGHGGSRRSAPLLAPEDVQATLCELTARTCASAVARCGLDVAEVLVCGGGALNAHLMHRIAEALAGKPVQPTGTRGLEAMQVEACAFAWLARAWWLHDAGNLPEVTGARGPRVLGALYPAR